MKQIQIKCDRCGKMVDGLIAEEDGDFKGATGGFYDVNGGYWGQFAKYGEKRICDECMFDTPEYKKIYGDRSIKS